MPTRPLVVALMSGLFYFSLHAQVADPPWVEVKSPHLTVASDAGETVARRIAWQYEQLQAAMKAVCPWTRSNLSLPVLVLAPRDEAGLKLLAPAAWEQANPVRLASTVGPMALDRYYQAVRADLSKETTAPVSPYFTAYWGQASAALQPQVRGELPLWFTRGLPTVFANATITEEGVQIGREVTQRARLLRSGVQRLSVRELLKIDRKSPWGTSGNPLFATFDAESWAFAQFLLLADNGAHRQVLDDFVAALLKGVPIAEAQDKAFANVDALEPAFLGYIERGTFEQMRVKIDPNIDRDRFAVRALTPVDIKAYQALFLTAMDRPNEARALAKEVQTLDASRPEPYEVDGLFGDRVHDERLARDGYEKAVALGSTNIYALFRLANILRSGSEVLRSGVGPDRATLTRVTQLMERAISVNPNHSQMQMQFGQVLLDLRRPFDAMLPLQRAVELDPLLPQGHISLADALWAAKLPEEALREARRALEVANTDLDRAMAQRAVTEYSR